MKMENPYGTISHVIHISSFQSNVCKLCHAGMSGITVEEAINHHISEHGFKLLHTGPISDINNDGSTLYGITAVLGK